MVNDVGSRIPITTVLVRSATPEAVSGCREVSCISDASVGVTGEGWRRGLLVPRGMEEEGRWGDREIPTSS
jgi:hypothetical protein